MNQKERKTEKIRNKLVFSTHNPPKPTTPSALRTNRYDTVQHNSHDSAITTHPCQAGKGRTGLMICCYMVHQGRTAGAHTLRSIYFSLILYALLCFFLYFFMLLFSLCSFYIFLGGNMSTMGLGATVHTLWRRGGHAILRRKANVQQQGRHNPQVNIAVMYHKYMHKTNLVELRHQSAMPRPILSTHTHTHTQPAALRALLRTISQGAYCSTQVSEWLIVPRAGSSFPGGS